jgi:putative component of membrane protein insertase Oxa1/YidC/SpoIIIJ protein YidD
MIKAISIFCIKLYWFLIPPSKRRKCIFKESCSKHVYRKLDEGGFKNGLNAFLKRYYQCRPGYKVFYNSTTTNLEIELSDYSIVQLGDMREDVFINYTKTLAVT